MSEDSSELSDSSSCSSSHNVETVAVEIHEQEPQRAKSSALPTTPAAYQTQRKRKRSGSKERSEKKRKRLKKPYIIWLNNAYVPDQGQNLDIDSDISADVSGELYTHENCTQEPVQTSELPARVKLINSIQHFDTEDWNTVRYAEVQKQYCSAPGFTYLETNEEIQSYDKYSSLALIERGFAAITQALIMQNEAAQSAFTALIEWARFSGNNITAKSLHEKVNELFIKGNFQKICSDVLQLACGHRAELVQQRRDNILRSVKDSFLKSSLRKIPPTSENLFNKESFSTAIEKSGGMSKVFWPLRAPTQNKAALQAQPHQQTQVTPSHAMKMPSAVNYHYPQFDYINRPPFQGAWNTFNVNSQGREYVRPTFRSNQLQQLRPFRQRPGSQNFQNSEMYLNAGRGSNKQSVQSGSRLTLPHSARVAYRNSWNIGNTYKRL
ncbi:unnamed protein product, partial [Brenthis ino]